MAKSSNNLKAVLEDTANAIRSKTGSASNIVPRFFADTISLLPNQELVNQFYSGTLVNVVIPDYVSTLRTYYLFANMTSLQSVDFNVITEIPSYCCEGCENLESVQFNANTTRIESNAFNGCIKIDNLSLPNTIAYFGILSFYGVGSYYNVGTHTFEFVGNNELDIRVRNNAFDNSHLSKFVGVLKECGTSAFGSCTSLTYVDIKLNNCSIDNGAFLRCSQINYFNIDNTSNITAISPDAFNQLASNTYQTATIMPFDFRNSTFTNLYQGTWGYCKFDGIVYLPTTLATISGNFLSDATGNWVIHLLSVPTVSFSSYIRDDNSDFTVKYCFRYDLLDTARIATNWSTHTSQMLGFGTGFTAGSTLPATTTGGRTLTWYSDISLTTQITTSASETDTYYCAMS